MVTWYLFVNFALVYKDLLLAGAANRQPAGIIFTQ